MADSSITTSLALLERCARERAEQQERADKLAATRARIDQLVQHRDRRRVERALEQSQAERRRRERVETQREAARRAGIREGEKIRATIEAHHDAEMRLMAMRHERELAAMAPAPSTRRPWWLALAAGLALVVGALSGSPEPVGQATSSLGITAAGRAEIATLTAKGVALEQQTRLLTEELALASQPAPAAEPSAPAPPPARWTAPRPTAPAPPPTPSCTDGIGDPCCAFGELVC